ncbi:ASCH domain-containing protein [Bacteroides sp.]|uniref:ASCH domain-containing protein n=1 Tax=Bacteroides sp. TaxID=29523 RepID=UPI002FCC0857
MKAITIKQPWTSLIVHGIKDIENRTWACPKKYIGQRVLIHASGFRGKKFEINLTDEQAKDAFATIAKECMFGSLPFGSIIGSVEIVDCVQNHPSVWAEKGVYNWVLANPILFANPIPAKGKLSFWDYHDVIEEGGKP